MHHNERNDYLTICIFSSYCPLDGRMTMDGQVGRWAGRHHFYPKGSILKILFKNPLFLVNIILWLSSQVNDSTSLSSQFLMSSVS